MATRLPFDGVPAGTAGVLTGVVLQGKAALAQRLLLLLLHILKAGLRQMVLEASTIASGGETPTMLGGLLDVSAWIIF